MPNNFDCIDIENYMYLITQIRLFNESNQRNI